MVATLLAVKLRSQFRSLASNVWSAVGVGLFVLLMLPGVVLVTLGLLWLGSEPGLRPTMMILAGATVVASWFLGSALFFALDDSLAASRLSLLPLRPRHLSLPLVLAEFLTLPGLFTLILTIGLVGGWATGPVEFLTAVVTTVIGLLTGITAGRILVTALTSVLNNRRSRDLLYIVIVFGVVAVAWLPSLLSGTTEVTISFSLTGLGTLAETLSWTPLGAAWAVPGAVAAGAWGAAGLHLVLALLFLALLWALWTWQLGRTLVSPIATSGTAREQLSWPWLDRIFPATPTGAIATRILRHLRRDPRRFLSLLMISLLPLLMVLVGRNAERLGPGPALPWLLLGMLTWLCGLTVLQDTSYDGSALWTHAVSGIRGRDDRLGRLLGNVLPHCLSLLLAALIGVWLTGQWSLLTTLLGLGLFALLSSMGLGLFISVFLTGTVPPPGSNPFASSMKGQGTALLAVLLQSLGMTVIAACCVLCLLLLDHSPWLGWVFLVLGPSLGAALAFGLCHWAGRCLDTRWAELVAAVTYEK